VVAAPAYDVILKAGSTMFTIARTDSISGPSSSVADNSNFTITDNSLVTWIRAVLSKLWQFSVTHTAAFGGADLWGRAIAFRQITKNM